MPVARNSVTLTRVRTISAGFRRANGAFVDTAAGQSAAGSPNPARAGKSRSAQRLQHQLDERMPDSPQVGERASRRVVASTRHNSRFALNAHPLARGVVRSTEHRGRTRARCTAMCCSRAAWARTASPVRARLKARAPQASQLRQTRLAPSDGPTCTPARYRLQSSARDTRSADKLARCARRATPRAKQSELA